MQKAEQQLEIAELQHKRDADKQKQLDYLLKQVEIYSHFIEKSEKPKPPTPKKRKKQATPKAERRG